MEAKQKAIQEAYGEHWGALKNYVDENGFIDSVYFPHGKLDVDFGRNNGELACDFLVRPLSLQGIENNNGWIKIESEADLPKENGAYYVVRNDDFHKNDIQTFIYDNCDSFSKSIWKSCVTHYQPIQKPKPPIY